MKEEKVVPKMEKGVRRVVVKEADANAANGERQGGRAVHVGEPEHAIGLWEKYDRFEGSARSNALLGKRAE